MANQYCCSSWQDFTSDAKDNETSPKNNVTYADYHTKLYSQNTNNIKSEDYRLGAVKGVPLSCSAYKPYGHTFTIILLSS